MKASPRVASQLRLRAAAACLAWCMLAAAPRPAAALETGEGEQPGAYVAVCAAVKDHPEDVREWVDYHAALGIGKFYLMDTDNAEAAGMAQALQDHVASGLVELFPLPHVNPTTVPLLQVRLYDICLNAVRNRHTFLGFWDIDEFMVPLEANLTRNLSTSIPLFLQRYERYGGVGVTWRTVGPSVHERRPEGGALKNFDSCLPWGYPGDEEVKSIVHTQRALEPTTNPHSFIYQEGYHAVDVEERPLVDDTRAPGVVEDWVERQTPPRMALYHFVTKSVEEFREKMRRGSGMGNRKDEQFFLRVMQAATETCPEAWDVCTKVGVKPWCA